MSYAKFYGVKCLILRYVNIIGPKSNHGIIIDFVKKLRNNPRKLEILGNGSRKKNYLYIGGVKERLPPKSRGSPSIV